ncbi:MAG: Dethiobiotin synthetase [uncultured Adhaeribacter sp.]|uniref:ATP-dependent dethiobiotin synthetase BioD n=1 Tax=uncultured Adhaeribacter sp. TaxID=448109 RepID=A0A6J4HAD9_9BACT|nr:MAG: Dethiobiotin synthetase [uncultured Adhaeribacter sp.]
MKQYFITGIGTEIGKTVVAAILTEALAADYWKPVQAGNLDYTDSDTVRSLISNPETIFHPEAYRLQMPASPHQAAAVENISINPNQINIPLTDRNLIVEGAGGLMVPLNHEFLMIDLIVQFKLPVILVSRHYLGSINHTLLSVEALRRRNIPLAGIIFNGAPTPASEEYILRFAGLPKWPNVLPETKLTALTVQQYAARFKPYLV